MADSADQWMVAATRHPLLTAAQEISLGTEVRRWLDVQSPDQRTVKRGQRARRRLVESNLRLVATVANKARPRLASCQGLEPVDLMQEGAIGLQRAAEKFDPQAGYKFSTYSYWWIRQAINRVIETQGNLIRLSSTGTTYVRRWKYREAGMTLEQFAEQQGRPVETVGEFLRLCERAKCLSLDAQISKGGDDEGSRRVDFIADESQDPEDALILEEIARGVAFLKHQCPDEAALVELKVIEGFTNAEIGEACGSNREVTRRNWHAAREKLRNCWPEGRALVAS